MIRSWVAVGMLGLWLSAWCLPSAYAIPARPPGPGSTFAVAGGAIVFETSGHLPCLEEPETFVRVVEAFLAVR